MKKKVVIASVATLVMGMSICSYHLGRYQAMTQEQNRVSYVEVSDKGVGQIPETLTPEEVSAKEDIDAEQIVVKITDQGYVTSHGDHFHYYNGKVPFDAIISEELLMRDPNYVLQDSHIVNEVQDGYIIKVDGRYYLYVKTPEQAKNVRTKVEIERQREAVTTDKGHQASKQGTKRYQTDDGYVFQPTDVIEDTGDGFIVPHGDHFHFIPKKDLSASELRAAQNYWNKRSNAQVSPQQFTSLGPTSEISSSCSKEEGAQSPTTIEQGLAPQTISLSSSTTASPKEDLISLLAQLDATPLSQRHREADGLVFDPRTITKKTGSGVVVPHGDHYHFIPYGKLSDLERKIVQLIGTSAVSVSTTPTSHPVVLENPVREFPASTTPTVVAPKIEVQPPVALLPTPVPTPALPEVVLPMPSLPETSLPTPSLPVAEKETSGIDLLGLQLTKSEKGRDGQPYSTSDGYVFEASTIISYDEQGLIARHGDHEHYIFYHELEDSELQEAQEFINGQQIEKNTDSSFTDAEIAAKLQFISLRSSVPVGSLLITGDKVIVPHGNHSHTVPLTEYPTRLRKADFADEEEYKILIMQLKLGLLRLREGVRNVARDSDQAVVVYVDGSREIVPLASIVLPLDYEEITYESFIEVKSERDLKLDYIAAQYGVGRGELFPVGANAVMINWSIYVDLDKVDITAPVIYTLLEEETESEEDSSPQTVHKESEEEPSSEVLIDHKQDDTEEIATSVLSDISVDSTQDEGQ